MQRAKRNLIVTCCLAAGLGTFAWPRFKPGAPPLTPTAQQLAAAFPENSRTIFRESDTFILYRLTGDFERVLRQDDSRFDGYPVVGKTVLRDQATIQKIISAYEEGLADTHFSTACFNPRHGIRVEKGKKRLDLVICFSCGQVQVITKTGEKYIHIGKQPQATFDAVLAAAGIPAAKNQE